MATAAASSPEPPQVVLPADWPLNEFGPWLVYLGDDGLVVANPDGSGATLLWEGDSLGPADLYDFDQLAAPTGARLALYTFDDPSALAGPSLQVITVPDGKVAWSTRLLSRGIEADLATGLEPDEPGAQAAQAVTMNGALAWSPDGRQLAFVAALDGPSSDLYVVNLDTGRQRRLTSGVNQSASPSWSPDGRWIAHQAVESFGTGAGWNLGAVWAAAADGGGVFRLYRPESGGEVFVDWSRGNSLIAYSITPDGLRDLRAASPESGIENVLVPSYFNDAAYDPESGTLAYAVPQSLADTGTEPGAYLWNPTWTSEQRIDPDGWSDVLWGEGAGRFFFEGPAGVLAVDPGGRQVDQTDIVDRVSPSPDGTVVALWGDGRADRASDLKLYTADLQRISTLAPGDFSAVVWRPDSAGLMAMGEDGLVYIPRDGSPILVDRTAGATFDGGIGWVP